ETWGVNPNAPNRAGGSGRVSGRIRNVLSDRGCFWRGDRCGASVTRLDAQRVDQLGLTVDGDADPQHGAVVANHGEAAVGGWQVHGGDERVRIDFPGNAQGLEVGEGLEDL